MGWRDAPLAGAPKAPVRPQARPSATPQSRLPSQNPLAERARSASRGEAAPPAPPRKSWRAAPTVKDDRSWVDTAAEAVQNIPSSAAAFGKSLYDAATDPVGTATALLDIGAGALRSSVPEPVRDFVDRFDWNPEAADRAVQIAQQVGGVYLQRYGSEEALKRTIATDPVGAMADLSTLFTGGAGLARGGAAVTARGAPRASAAAAKIASVYERAATVTNPVNVMAKPAAMIPKVIQRVPVAAQRIVSPKGTAYLEAAEGQAPALIQQLRSPNLEIVPGSRPTAAQAASPLGLTKFSALGASAEKVLPTEYFARGTEQATARANAMRGVAGTPASMEAAVAARGAATKPLYKAADEMKVAADSVFETLLGRPSMDKVIARAKQLAAEENVPFQVGQNRPARSEPSVILNAEGQPIRTIDIPAEYAQYTGRSLHLMKMAFDDLIRNPERFGIGATEARAIGKTRDEFIRWTETQVPPYGAARKTFAEMSKPINQMAVGQFLEGKLATPLDVGERANVFAAAVKDAPGTLRKATTGEMRFKALTDILDPDQVRVIESIRDDLARAAETKAQARAGAAAAPKAGGLATAATRNIRSPQFLSRVATVANDIMARLGGKIDRRLALQIATEMLDPQTAAAALEKAMVGEARAARVGQVGAAAASAFGRGLRAPVTLAGERVRNAMLNAPAQPMIGEGALNEYDEYGNPLFDEQGRWIGPR